MGFPLLVMGVERTSINKRQRTKLLKAIASPRVFKCRSCGEARVKDHFSQCHACFEDFVMGVTGGKCQMQRDEKGRLKSAWINL